MKRKIGHRPMTTTKNPEPVPGGIDWLIWAAWADRVTFEDIKEKTDLNEDEVIDIMRRELKTSSFKRWRKRVHQSSIKHRKKFEHKRKKMSPKHASSLYLYTVDET